MAGKAKKQAPAAEVFRSPEEEALVSLLRAGEYVANRLAETLKSHGISRTQYDVLRILRGAGDQQRSCGEIAELMFTRDPDVTRLVDRLELHDLVVRSRDGKDRRVVNVRITEAGRQLVGKLDGPVLELLDELFAPLSGKKTRRLISVLALLRATPPRS